MPRVMFDRPLHEKARAMLSEGAEIIECFEKNLAELKKVLKNVDGAICSAAFKIDEDDIACAVRLKVIGRPGVGYDSVDVAGATRQGVPVVYAPDGPTESVAEHVLALMIMLAKKIRLLDWALREQGDFSIRTRITGTELYGRTLGIVGAGRIGGRVAEMAYQALNMNILVYDPYFSATPPGCRYRRVNDLHDLLREADVVSIHSPLNEKTRGMIGRAEFAAMKSGALFINTSRGPVVDESALVEALGKEVIGGAGLDVYAQEPPDKDNPLFRLENTVLTPHCSSFTDGGQLKMGMDVVQGVLDVLHGREPRFLVNPEVWPQRRR